MGPPASSYRVLIVGVGLALLVMSVVILAQFGVIPGRSLPGRVGLEMERVAAALSILVLFPAALLITALEGGRPALRELFARMLRWRVGIRLVAVRPPRAARDHRAGGGCSATRRICPDGVLVGELLELAAGLFPDQYLGRGDLGGILPDSPGAPAQLLCRGRPDGPAVHRRAHAAAGDQWRDRVGLDLVVAFALLFVVTIVVRSLFGMVLRGAVNSVLLVAVTHLMFNRSANSDGIVADMTGGDNRQTAVLLATLVLTVALGVILRKKLSRSFRHELDDRERKQAVMTEVQQEASGSI